MTMKYTIPHIPPSNNEYIGRNACWDYRDKKQEWHVIVMGKPDQGAQRGLPAGAGRTGEKSEAEEVTHELSKSGKRNTVV